MARLDVEISDELAGWIQDEVKRAKSTKVAFVTGILEIARATPGLAAKPARQEPAPPTEDDYGNYPEPAWEPQGEPVRSPEIARDTGSMRRLQITLERLFKQQLASHPARTDLTDEDEEALEERWADIETSINAELAK